MPAIENPANYQCALTKSSRKHYLNAIEAYGEGKPVQGHLTAATETAEACGDTELSGWLNGFKNEFDTSGTPNTTIASNIAGRYNAYNQICGWGLDDFDVNDPFGLPGGGGEVTV